MTGQDILARFNRDRSERNAGEFICEAVAAFIECDST